MFVLFVQHSSEVISIAGSFLTSLPYLWLNLIAEERLSESYLVGKAPWKVCGSKNSYPIRQTVARGYYLGNNGEQFGAVHSRVLTFACGQYYGTPKG